MIALRFHARDVNLVMGSGREGNPVLFKVLVDGGAPADAGGLDLDQRCDGALMEARLYQLGRQSGPIEDRRSSPPRPRRPPYVFTFGLSGETCNHLRISRGYRSTAARCSSV